MTVVVVVVVVGLGRLAELRARKRHSCEPVRDAEMAYFGASWRQLGCVLLSTLLFFCASIVVKVDKLSDGTPFPIIALSFCRAATTGLLGAVGCHAHCLPVFPRRGFRATLCGGVCDFASGACFYYSCSHLPLFVAIVMSLTPPVAVVLLSGIRGRACFVEMRSALVTVSGVVAVIGGSDGIQDFREGQSRNISRDAVGVAVVGAMLQACSILAADVSARNDGVHWLHGWVVHGVVALSFLLAQALISTEALSLERCFQKLTMSGDLNIVFTLLFLLCAEGGSALLNASRGGVSRPVAAVVRMLQAPCSAAIGVLLFGEQFHPVQVVGCAVVLSGCFALCNRKVTLQPDLDNCSESQP
mmetsp:Transcript_1809/g.4155  ORF Transcript_1809/g.4155 Transcript_1809/m.4155 type:complete len:358 (+) Transcript_1809:250-1323(+)